MALKSPKHSAVALPSESEAVSGGRLQEEDSEGIAEFFVGEIVLAEQIVCRSRVGRPLELPCEAEMVPADDAVPDQLVAGFGGFLIFLLGPGELAANANGGGAGETARQLDLAGLHFNRLPQDGIIDIAMHEQR